MTTSTKPMTRAGATRATAITRAACVVFGVGAVALGMVGLPDRAPPSTTGIPPGMPGDPPAGGAGGAGAGQITPTSFAPVDADAVAARLAMLGNAPAVPVAPPEDPTPEVDTDEPPTAIASLADRVRYLGMVSSGDRRAAFLSIDGAQRILREGATVSLQNAPAGAESLVIDRIGPRAVMMRSGDERTAITLAERTGASVTMVAGGEIERLNTPESNDAQKLEAAGEISREEERRLRMLDRGRGDPENLQRVEEARARIEARRNQARGAQNEVDAASGQNGEAADPRSEQPGRNRWRNDD